MFQWKQIKGFEGLYEVSNEGDVRRDAARKAVWPNTNSKPGQLLKTRQKQDGYLIVGMYKDGWTHTLCVHRLVAIAFLGERPDGAEINHVDGDKRNNRANNLEYVSHQRNIDHAVEKQLLDHYAISMKGESHWRAKLTEENVREILASKDSSASLARKFNVREQTIYRVRNKTSWRHISGVG